MGRRMPGKEGMPVRATVLVDNIAYNGIKGEWGLSFYIEYQGHNILLDTGASGLFAENARDLGLSLKDVEYAVLSHAHYDHADGMGRFFEENDRAKFYLREACAENCYKKGKIFKKYIGIARGNLKKYRDRIVYVDEDKVLVQGVTLLGHHTEGTQEIGRQENMYVRRDGQWRTDDFAHEQSLVFETDGGLVIFNSCSHIGADNIIREAEQEFPGKKIRALAGGFHLYNKTEAQVRAFAKRVEETGIEKLYTGHCTGAAGYEILKDCLGDIVQQFRSGLVMEF